MSYYCGTYGVPDLKFDYLVVDLKAEGPKLNTNRDLMFLLELIIHDPLHEARFADSSVPNDDEFEKMVLRAQGLISDHFEIHALQLSYLILLHILIAK